MRPLSSSFSFSLASEDWDNPFHLTQTACSNRIEPPSTSPDHARTRSHSSDNWEETRFASSYCPCGTPVGLSQDLWLPRQGPTRAGGSVLETHLCRYSDRPPAFQTRRRNPDESKIVHVLCMMARNFHIHHSRPHWFCFISLEVLVPAVSRDTFCLLLVSYQGNDFLRIQLCCELIISFRNESFRSCGCHRTMYLFSEVNAPTLHCSVDTELIC